MFRLTCVRSVELRAFQKAVRDADHSDLRSGRLSVSMDIMADQNDVGQVISYETIGDWKRSTF